MPDYFETGSKKGRGMAQRSLDLIETMHVITKDLQPITGRGIGYQLFTRKLIAAMSRTEMKRVYRHIEGIFDSLKDIGIETLDLTGRAYDSGMALKFVSFEQTPGLSKEEITETIKPAVIWDGRLVQLSEVIVGTP